MRGSWGARRCGRAARAAASLAVALLVAGSCGGTGADPGRVDAVAVPLPAELCDVAGDLDERNRELEAPGVYDLDADALASVLAVRRRLLEDAAALATGDLRRRLEDQVAAQAAIDADMLDTWDVDRTGLAAAHSDSYGAETWGETVRTEDGTELSTAHHLRDAGVVRERLVIGCRAPELTGGPAQKTSQDPPPGRLVFVRGGEGIAVADTTGADERVLQGPDGWHATDGLDVVPGRDDAIVVGARQDGDFGLVVMDARSALRHVASRPGEELTCPQWDDTGTVLLATSNTAAAVDRKVFLIDPTGNRPSGPLELPFASVGCADLVDDRLVVSHAARRHGDGHGVWTVGLDGSDPRLVHRVPAACNSALGGVDPTGTRVALHQTCGDPLLDGVWVVDLATGEADHIVTGHAGPPKWSPDGSWLVFGFQALGSDDGMSIWMVRADGRQLREVVGDVAFTPVWLPPA